ncbi:hypothetical protein Tco_1289427 [Tanacetum coccineum]
MVVSILSYSIRVMDPNLSLGKICLGDDVIEISSDKVEGPRDWDSSEYQDTAGSKGKKVKKALTFYRMETDEVSERYITPCFINGLEAYDGEIHLAFDENLISNEFAVKSFIRLVNGIVDFGNGVITVYPEEDPFEDNSEKTENSPDDWDHLLDFNLDDVPQFGEELLLFVYKMGKKEAAKEALAIRISQKFALLEEVKPVIETIAYHDKYKKVLDEIWKDKVELDGKIVKEEEETIKKVKGEALKEKDDLGAFIFPIRLEGKVNENALADTGSDINTMPYRIYETLGREEMKKVDRGITMINHTQAEAIGMITNVLCQVGVTTIIAKFLILDIPIDRDAPIVVGRGFLYTIESNSDDEEEYQIKRNKFEAPIYGLKPAPYLNCNDPVISLGQYYQQYPPPPPQYQQQQPDDDE